MISKISYEQFQKELNTNVMKGNPWIKGSPFALFTVFDSKTKYFYGKHDKANFTLTRNSGILNLTEFVIEGTYNPTEQENETAIDFKINRIPFGYWWIRLTLPLALTVISIILLIKIRTEISTIAIVWFWLGIPWVFGLWRSKKLKRQLEIKFKDFFKIS